MNATQERKAIARLLTATTPALRAAALEAGVDDARLCNRYFLAKGLIAKGVFKI